VTLTALSDLGLVFQLQGKYNEAEEIDRRALAGRGKMLGMEHPDTLSILSSLGLLLRYQGIYQAAREISQRDQQKWKRCTV